MVRYVCEVCGCILDGNEPPLECPICLAESKQFRIDVNANVVKNYGDWDGWKDIKVGHSQAVTVMKALLSRVEAFKKELEDANRARESQKELSQSQFDQIVDKANKECEGTKNVFRNEYEKLIHEADARIVVAQNVDRLSTNYVDSLPALFRVSARNENRKVKDSLSRVMHAIEAQKKAYSEMLKCQEDELERTKNAEIERALNARNFANRQADCAYDAQINSISDGRKSDFERGFNRDLLNMYAHNVMAARFNAASYECPNAIPDYIMLGNIGVALPSSRTTEKTIVQAVLSQARDYSEMRSERCEIKLPYAQRLEDGISLLMRYSPRDRECVQSMIQPLLLKLFMTFPAGKLEATMIDPLELGSSFSDIPKLAEGPNSARIIDTKIWSKEKDIEDAISTLRQRMENLTQAYGGDRESMLKKEVCRVLAITDFPIGFNSTALKDLLAIVRNSAALGVSVLICANDEELNKLKENNGALANEIAQSVIETKAKGNKLALVSDERIFLQLDSMEDVMERKDIILTKIRDVIEHMQLKTEHFDSMYKDDIFDSNNWFMGSHTEIALPIGVKGANTIIKMVLGKGGGSTEHHALIAGKTGAGKSTLLHTMIMSTLVSYSPDEVQMYILDFKEGVEFRDYTRYRLPSLRVVAINSEREFGLNVLKELCTELETRTKQFSRYGVSDINSYFDLFDVPKIPKLLLIFDEVQELFRSGAESDTISKECLSCINKLVMQGRAMGIHIILACQDFRNCAGLDAYFSQMAIRIVIKGAEDGGASILSADNNGANTLREEAAGAAIYNGSCGVESANNFFQVSILEREQRLELLERMNAYFTDPDYSYQFDKYKTRILLTNAQDDIYNCFNKLINFGIRTVEPLGSSEDGYGLLLGQGFGKKNRFLPELRRKDRDNLLVMTRDEKMALGLFELSAMSVLYEELHTNADKDNALIYIADLFDTDLSDEESDFTYLADQFPKQIKVASKAELVELISDLYETLLNRTEGQADSSERIFFLFFGINRAKNLVTGSMYDNEMGAELSPVDKLIRILKNGPKNGINTILWGESPRGAEHILGNQYYALFDKRIAYELDADYMDILVSESDVKAIRGKTAVYMGVSTDIRNTHFRPYEVPTKVWIDDYADAYDIAINE